MQQYTGEGEGQHMIGMSSVAGSDDSDRNTCRTASEPKVYKSTHIDLVKTHTWHRLVNDWDSLGVSGGVNRILTTYRQYEFNALVRCRVMTSSD